MGNITNIAQGTMIGFSANKSESDAMQDKSSNRMVICKTKQLYLNGERVGLTDAEATYISNKMKAENQATANGNLSVTLTATPQVYERHGITTSPSGSTAVGGNVTITAVVKYNNTACKAQTSAGADLNELTIKVQGSNGSLKLKWNDTSKLYEADDTQKYNPTVGTYAVTIYKKDASLGVIAQKTASVTISAYDYIYFGVTTNDKIANNTITGFVDGASGSMNTGTTGGDVMFKALSKLQSSAAGTYKFDIPQNGYAYILIPQGVAKGKFASAGGDGYYHASEGVSDVPFVKLDNLVTSSLASSISTDKPITPLVTKGITFEVFRLASAQNASTHSFTI